MSNLPQHQAVRITLGVSLAVVLLATAGLLGIGIIVALGNALPLGWLLITLAIGAIGLTILLYTQACITQKHAATVYRAYVALLDATDELHRQSGHTHTIAENSSLSDWAKQIVYREKDFEYLRDQIRGAFVRDDWAAAEHMIRDMVDKLGHVAEADRLRAELEQARQATKAEKLSAAIARFDELCTAQRWREARAETERLAAQFPDEPDVQSLAAQLDQRRSAHKRSLLKQYDEAVGREDVDAAHKLLLQLDAYLTANEVAALKDSARGVFRARLMQLGARFSVAVSDKRFDEAVTIGESVVKEYPNSRYAHEISELLPTLRERGHV